VILHAKETGGRENEMAKLKYLHTAQALVDLLSHPLESTRRAASYGLTLGGAFHEGAVLPFCAVICCPYRDSPYKRERGEEE
jgi:hypothetical protein